MFHQVRFEISCLGIRFLFWIRIYLSRRLIKLSVLNLVLQMYTYIVKLVEFFFVVVV